MFDVRRRNTNQSTHHMFGTFLFVKMADAARKAEQDAATPSTATNTADEKARAATATDKTATSTPATTAVEEASTPAAAANADKEAAAAATADQEAATPAAAANAATAAATAITENEMWMAVDQRSLDFLEGWE